MTFPQPCRQPILAPGDSLAPSELRRELEQRMAPYSFVVDRRETVDVDGRQVLVERHRVAVEDFAGERIWVSCIIGRPAGQAGGKLAPVLWVPGGHGIARQDGCAYMAAKANVVCLWVDWLGRGESSSVPGVDPSPQGHAVYFDGDDWRNSFQFHNLMALLRAIEHLLAQDGIEASRLTCSGTSWGGFYTWLLSSMEERIAFAVISFGCGFYDMGTRNIWQAAFEHMGRTKTEAWLRAYDPGRKAKHIRAAVYFETVTNDKFFPVPAAMASFREVPGQKHLMMLENQDHFLRPFGMQHIKLLKGISDDGHFPVTPSFSDLKVDAACGRVTFSVANIGEIGPANVSLIYSEGGYTTAFGRRWHRIPATPDGDRWQADIPLSLAGRPVWCYAHVEFGPGRAVSSEVEEFVAAAGAPLPQEVVFEVGSEPIDRQPVGDRLSPPVALRKDAVGQYYELPFAGARYERGVIYACDGDILARLRPRTLEVTLYVAPSIDLDAAWILLVCDYHSFEEQSYGVPLANLRVEAGKWQTVSVPIDALQFVRSRGEHWAEAPAFPLNIGRVGAVAIGSCNGKIMGKVLFRRFRFHECERSGTAFQGNVLTRFLGKAAARVARGLAK